MLMSFPSQQGSASELPRRRRYPVRHHLERCLDPDEGLDLLHIDDI